MWHDQLYNLGIFYFFFYSSRLTLKMWISCHFPIESDCYHHQGWVILSNQERRKLFLCFISPLNFLTIGTKLSSHKSYTSGDTFIPEIREEWVYEWHDCRAQNLWLYKKQKGVGGIQNVYVVLWFLMLSAGDSTMNAKPWSLYVSKWKSLLNEACLIWLGSSLVATTLDNSFQSILIIFTEL